ncbi:MAG TPA: response regulator transcription factor [Gaiellaceae bacterium]
MIGVVVVGEIRLYRDGLAGSLAARPGFDVLATAADVAGAVAVVRTHGPDIALVDMAMADGVAVVRAVVSAAPQVKVVAVAVPDDDVIECAEAGVSGYVTRDGSVEDVVDMIEAVARDELPCSPRMAATLLRRVAALAANGAPHRPERRLTSREFEVLELIEAGLPNKEIARRLVIQLATVKNHVHNILEKLDVDGRAAAAVWLRTDGRAKTGPLNARKI